MARLAIKYEEKWKKEIISFLVNIGGEDNLAKFMNNDYCYIDINGHISSIKDWNSRLKDFCKFTYQELIDKFPYLPGDRVILKEILRVGDKRCDSGFIFDMFWNGSLQQMRYIIKFDTEMIGNKDYGSDDLESEVSMVDDSVNEFFVQSGKITSVNFQDQNYSDEVELCLNNLYEIQKKDDKWFAVKKKIIFPKTYKECCLILGRSPDFSIVTEEDNETYKSFIQLKRCRDAYWLLLENWKPDWNNDEIVKYCIIVDSGIISKQNFRNSQFILAFPTKEIRDSFYENFKNLIEKCKELL